MKDSSAKVRYIKPVAIVLSLLVLFALFGLGRGVRADGELNPSEIDLYFLDPPYDEAIGTIPSEYKTSYKINVNGLTGTPTYKVVKGHTAEVSSDGVISPCLISKTTNTSKHYAGTSIIKVFCGEYSREITVNVKNYAATYANAKMNRILDEIITDGMTEYDKLYAITSWVAKNTDYSPNYTTWSNMMIFECGDCWASTNTIVEMCSREGIEARSRWANEEPGAGITHMNAIARCDGDYYVAEAGYTGNRPRYFNLSKRPYGFFAGTSIIYQYDGFETDVVVPAEIDGYKMTEFGGGSFAVLNSSGIESIRLPDTIKTIGAGAFNYSKEVSVSVDPDNKFLTTINGAIYSKDKTKLFYVPRSSESFSFDDATTMIVGSGLYSLSMDRLVIPGNVKELGAESLMGASFKDLQIEEGLESIGDSAFRGLTAPQLVLPSSVKSIGSRTFRSSRINKVVLPSSIIELPDELFYQSNVIQVELSEGTKRIGEKAFWYSSFLTNISIPKSVTEIGKDAFTGCGKLHICYEGSQEEWSKITFGSEIPGNVKLHFNSVRVTGIDCGDNKEITLTEKGQRLALNACVLPSNASNTDIEYSSDKTSVVRVEGNEIVAVSEGECTVTVTSADGGFTDSYHVTVRYPRYTITIDGGYVYLPIEYKGLTEVQCLPGETIRICCDKSIHDGLLFKKWILDEDIDTLNGKITYSTLSIVVPAKDIVVRAEYDKVPVSTITFAITSNSSMCPEDSRDLNLRISPDYAYDQTVTWSSNDESIVIVDENGHVTAVSPGIALVKATANDGSGAYASIYINVIGHSWKETGRVNATTETDGYIDYCCEYCHREKRETIPKIEPTDPVDPVEPEEPPVTYYYWYTIGKDKYYINNLGVPATGLWTIEGKVYYFTKNGKMVTKWKEISGNWYYFTANGAKTGWQTISKKKYYFSKKGVMATGLKTISSKTYYFNKDGTIKTGWKTVSKKKYYFTTKGAKTGWQTISKKKYYFDKTGVMATGSTKISGKYYLFGTDGVLAKSGWRQDAKGKYYYVKKTGQVTTGWKTISGKKYFFSKKGVMATGLTMISGKAYLFSSKGLVKTGWKTVDGNKYYFTSKGAKTGWYSSDGYKYYFGADGIMAKGLTAIGDKLYYFDKSGHMKTGKVTIDGQEYEFASTGEAVVIPETAPED